MSQATGKKNIAQPEAWVSREHMTKLVDAFGELSQAMRRQQRSQLGIAILAGFGLGGLAVGLLIGAILLGLPSLLIVPAVCVLGVVAFCRTV